MKSIQIITIFLAATAFAGCKQDKFTEYKGEAYIYFASNPGDMHTSSTYYTNRALADSSQSYTFFYDDETVRRAELKYYLYVSGGPKDYDRPFVLEQVEVAGAVNAVPGENYVAFDSDEMKELLVMKAGDVYMQMPIIALRTVDTDDQEYLLRFRLIENEHFMLGQSNLTWRKALFTSGLQRPTQWTSTNATNYYGKYSFTKHSWMIEETGLRWDNDCMDAMAGDERNYWCGLLKRRLVEINAERAANDLDPWEDEDGDEIAMGRYN